MTNSNTALITGASAGIGATYADRLARRGHDLILVARDEARLTALAERLRAETGRAVEVLVADLTAKADLLAVEQRLRTDASIGLLVNNAGMATPGQLIGADVDQLEMMVQLNVVAALRLAQAAVDAFVARNAGTLINISSVLAVAPERMNGAYSGTKSFLLNLSMAYQAELAGTGVRVQAVLPAGTRTEIWGKMGIDLASQPADRFMAVGELVDAALAGLDMGESVTIPPLQDAAEWQRFDAARLALGPKLTPSHAAPRYNRDGKNRELAA
jgi:short-subunit dehydrogenase